MSARPTTTALARRIGELERERRFGPLTAVERLELDRLEADFDRQFPGVRQSPDAIAELSDEQIEAYLQYETGRDGRAQRMHELRMRARTPEEVERDSINGQTIRAMSDQELEAYLNGQIKLHMGKIEWMR